MNELSQLKSRKHFLDDRLSELQDTRKELMTELEELMKLLYSSQDPQQPQQQQQHGSTPQIVIEKPGSSLGRYGEAAALYGHPHNELSD